MLRRGFELVEDCCKTPAFFSKQRSTEISPKKKAAETHLSWNWRLGGISLIG